MGILEEIERSQLEADYIAAYSIAIKTLLEGNGKAELREAVRLADKLEPEIAHGDIEGNIADIYTLYMLRKKLLARIPADL